jgi:predicted amidohydrolase YtcJ
LPIIMYKLFYNGKINTLSKHKPYATAILTLKDRIVYIGDSSDINLPDFVTDKINLSGKYVIPGFIDCHSHIAAVALAKERIRLDNCRSLEQALAQVRTDITNFKPGSWILGSGWNANIWLDGEPHKKLLDDISSQHAIVLYNKDGHAQWLNSLALKRCNFTDSTPDPEGGKLHKDTWGKLTGIVFEKACALVDQIAENVTYETLKHWLDITYPEMYACGITSVHSCEDFNIFKIFQQMSVKGELKLRICMHPPAADRDRLVEAGLLSGNGNEWLRLGGLKYFVDGSLGSQSAEMSEPYELLNHRGIEVTKEQDLTDQVCQAVSYGLSATIHAIGDKANHKALNALQKARSIKSPIPLRHRIEHCQILNKTDIPRFKELNIIASMQPLHIADDIEIADKYLGERAAMAYPIGSLKKTGCRIVFGSDMPIADPDPIKGILAAMCRKYKLDKTKPIWFPEECIESQEALLAYTRDATFASYEESLKGTLEPGKLADFIVLSHNIGQTDEQLLRDARVEKTILGGEIVFGRD